MLLHSARPAAVGARLLLAEGQGLLFQKGGKGALGQAGRSRGGELLEGGEVDGESGALFAEGAAGDDFAPLGGEVAEFLEVLGRELAA